MLGLTVITVGKIKEKSVQDAVSEYEKRLGRFCAFKSIEIPDLPVPKNASASDEEKVLRREGESILAKIIPSAFVVALCVEGRTLSSVAFAEKLASIQLSASSVVFVVGSSLGLSPEVKKRADFALSMSEMTFPHNLARLMLTEQIYRAFKIIGGETYHK